MAASTAPLLLAAWSGLAIAVTIASFTIAWVVARETRRLRVWAAFAAGVAAFVLVSVTAPASGTIIVLLADWLVLCAALLALDRVDDDAPPRRSLWANLRVTAIVCALFAALAQLSDQETALTAGLALSAVVAVALAVSMRPLVD
jgi:cytochrome bd-type quinol oxidase subunit 2